MSIAQRIQSDLSAAAKAQDRPRLAALRLLVDALQKEAKQARGDLDEQDEIAVLKRERKRRVEAADAYRKGGRADTAAAEEAEAELIDVYLPAQISDDELQQLIADALAETGAQSPKEMGKVMSAVMAKAAGRADGRRVSELVRERLTAA
ncbi:MAG: GatB/YqeY domain-containing protein [Solirubrobacterales bacterium]